MRPAQPRSGGAERIVTTAHLAGVHNSYPEARRQLSVYARIDLYRTCPSRGLKNKQWDRREATAACFWYCRPRWSEPLNWSPDGPRRTRSCALSCCLVGPWRRLQAWLSEEKACCVPVAGGTRASRRHLGPEPEPRECGPGVGCLVGCFPKTDSNPTPSHVCCQCVESPSRDERRSAVWIFAQCDVGSRDGLDKPKRGPGSFPPVTTTHGGYMREPAREK